MITVIVSFIISVLSGLGVGSGGILVVYLTVFEEISQHVSQGINLAFLVCSGGVSSFFNIKNEIVLKNVAFILSVCGIIGCIIGSFSAFSISHSLMQKIFGIFLVISGTIGLVPFVCPPIYKYIKKNK